jgi:tungstate transport system ATP-binding protein
MPDKTMHGPVSDLPIVFDDVSFRAGGVIILDGISLQLGAGRPTVLIGPNGSGKSTFIRVAMGLLTPTRGSLTWGGRSGDDGRRRAMVFQRPVMLRRSATANVRYALASGPKQAAQTAARVADLMQRVGLAGLGRRPARRLSGGEQQRLALARALARDPEVLFLDEPTASLDPASTKGVEDIVRATAAAGVKIVMATHDLGQARRLAGDIVFLVRGGVAEHAIAEDFFTNPQTAEAAAFLRGELVI